ncbi:unnamed protein product, partial [Dibothriocephalus latus]
LLIELTFAHAFWGEKNIGFETLIQNLKSGLKNTNDFYEFLRELNSLEDSYGKLCAKLSKQISNYATVGSFKPCWNIILETLDQMVLVKGSMCAERLNLMKDVQKYSEELQKKHRQLRENEAGTQEVVHAFQVLYLLYHKGLSLSPTAAFFSYLGCPYPEVNSLYIFPHLTLYGLLIPPFFGTFSSFWVA